MEQYNEHIRTLISKAVDSSMRERGINVNKLTELSGVSKSSVYRILNSSNYEIDILISICRILQIHIDFSLLTENDLHFDHNMKQHYKN